MMETLESQMESHLDILMAYQIHLLLKEDKSRMECDSDYKYLTQQNQLGNNVVL